MIWTVLLAISVPSLAFASQEKNQCPRKEDIKYCDCKILYPDTFKSGNFVETQVICEPAIVNELRKTFVNLRSNKKLRIQINSFLRKIPSDLFKGLDVISLSFDDHYIQRFGDEGRSSFEGLENTLQQLRIFGNYRKEPLEFLNITALNVLHRFDITIRAVPTLGNDLFAKGPASLKKLDIHSSETREIGHKIFEKLVNLNYLSLNADIDDFRRSMLPSPALKLFSLDLSYNRISSLPEDMFVDMPSLRIVTLEGNRIARLPEATWSVVWSPIVELNLEENPLQCDTHIEWMFKFQWTPWVLEGTCETPEYYKGKELKAVIQENNSI